jgi:glycosyltransferase involved in cell wall biosynthesis
MEQMNFDPDLIGPTSQAMNEIAKNLLCEGEVDLARGLIQHAAELELLSSELQMCWGGPFNGQTGRIAIVDELVAVLKPQAIIETGTFRGISTLWFARNFNGPVWSCEAEELYIIQAQRRLRDCSNVRVEHADSRDFLKRLMPKFDSNAPLLFYLDSHWGCDLPLREELQIIFTTHSKAVAIVDDFRIPDDPGYGWDDYGPGRRVDAAQLVGALPDGSSIYFPRLSSADESGEKRGCCVIAFRSSESVNACRLLRRQSLSEVVFSAERQDAPSTDSTINTPITARRDRDCTRLETRMVTDLRQELVKVNLDRALRLRDSLELRKQLSISEADRERRIKDINFLVAEKMGRLRDFGELQKQLSVSEADRERCLKNIDILRAENQRQLPDLNELRKQFSISEADRERCLKDIGVLRVETQRQLEALAAAEGDRKLLRQQIEDLTEMVKRLVDEFSFEAFNRTWLTRLGYRVFRRRQPEAFNQASLIGLAYRIFLSREPEPDVIEEGIKLLDSGLPFRDIITGIATSDESIARIRNIGQSRSGGEEQAAVWRAAIASTYAHFLKRHPSEEEITALLQRLEEGISLESFILSVANSDEAKFKAAEAQLRPELPDGEIAGSDESIAQRASIWRIAIAFTYAHFLKRHASEEEITARLRCLGAGISLESFILSVANSDEAKFKAAEARLAQSRPGGEEQEFIWRAAISSTYAHFLKRQASEEEIGAQLRGLEVGISLESFIRSVANSDEAKFRAAEAEVRPEISDGEFLVTVGQLLYGRGLTPIEVVIGQKFLNGASAQRHQFVSNKIDELVGKEKAEPAVTDPDNCWIMGTTKFLTRQLWEQRGGEISARRREMRPPLSERRFTHSGSFRVSMIASLYRGRDYISNFLDNITSQSVFDTSELIIVDANSPEREWELIEKYQEVYDNIVYKRLDYRISIYQAWNLGVELARGRYLTNTNLDDLRRSDSIELQAALLDQNADVDVVYQDVYYSLDANLPFDAVAAYGFKTELPIITPHNLLQFNSPHNAPMWRKSLHNELGLFDTRYESAGDYEFWFRCLVARKSFRKINTPHVVYYQNPKGVSTKPNTRGMEEAHELLRRYSRKLMSRTLLLSRRDFLAEVGLKEEEADVLGDLSYYDVAQRELLRLGAGRFEA